MHVERNYGLDLYRIFCCIGVLTYHIMDDVLGKSGGGTPEFFIFQLRFVCRDSFYFPVFCLEAGKH